MRFKLLKYGKCLTQDSAHRKVQCLLLVLALLTLMLPKVIIVVIGFIVFITINDICWSLE